MNIIVIGTGSMLLDLVPPEFIYTLTYAFNSHVCC